MAAKNKEIDYSAPPIVEVVVGVYFQEIPEFQAPHFGLFWNVVKEDFPKVQQVEPRLNPESAARFEDMPIRCWYLSSGDRRIIQAQRDSFHFNWRRMKSDAPGNYPEFSTIFSQFKDQLGKFRTFNLEAFGTDLVCRGAELTYINVIPTKPLCGYLELESDVLIDHQRQSGTRFLPQHSDFEWNTHYNLPNDNGTLTVSARSATVLETNATIIRLGLSANTSFEKQSWSSLDDWFDLAHDYIVKGFADVTNSEVQKNVWRRK